MGSAGPKETAPCQKSSINGRCSRTGGLEAIDERILTVAGEIAMPLGRFPRRMTVVGLSGGRSAVWSAIALHEAEMLRIEALGRPAFLIVPSDHHRLDVRIWQARYPDALVVAPPGPRRASPRRWRSMPLMTCSTIPIPASKPSPAPPATKAR